MFQEAGAGISHCPNSNVRLVISITDETTTGTNLHGWVLLSLDRARHRSSLRYLSNEGLALVVNG